MNTEDDINAIYDDAEDQIQGIMDKFWGGVCISDDQCYQGLVALKMFFSLDPKILY